MKGISKEINFIPDFMEKEKEQKKRMVKVAILTTIFTLMCFAVYFIPDLQTEFMEAELTSLESREKLMADVKQIKDDLEDTEKKLNQKKSIIEEVSKGEVDIVFVLDKLTSAAPQNVKLSYFSTSDSGEISASYIINNPVEGTKLVANLRKFDIFERVDMPSMPMVDRKTDISFRLKLKSNKEK